MGGGAFLQENHTSALEFLTEQGVDLSTPEAAASVLENTELMAEAQERGVTRGLVIAIFDAVSGGVAGQTILKSPAGDMVVQGIAQAALGGGGEAAAQVASGQEFSPREVVIEGLAELATAPIEVLGVGGRKLTDELGRFAKSGETAARLDEIDERAAASKVRERSPDHFLSALEKAGAPDLYVSAEGLREYFQSKDIELDQETLEAFGVDPVDFQEKVATGGDITLPVAHYAAHISGTEDAAWFRDNSVLDPDEMSVSEAAEFNEQVRLIVEEEFERNEAARLQSESERSSDVQVYDEMFSQLRSAGQSVDVAEQNSLVWSAFWRSMASRYDEDSLDLARMMGVEVRGAQSETPRRRDAIDLQLNVLRSQGPRALRPKGRSLLNFLRDEGGVQDAGGELGDLELPPGVVSESSAEISARRSEPTLGGLPNEGRGMVIDDAVRRAIEAGYFPEFQGRENEAGLDFRSAFFEAVQAEQSGDIRFPEGEGPDQDLVALADELSELGLDLADLTNDEAVAALEGAAERGRELGQERRGSIQLPEGGLLEGQTVINLFESADLSTFLHESGHFFLEAFTELSRTDSAPAQMQDDLNAIRKFLEVEEGQDYSTEQHEMWARGFEAYLMEGKAPSLELASAFSRFKAWLSRIYRSVRGLNVNLTPEIREVMDRMLATEDEIAVSREAQAMRPLFSEAPAGMSDADWAAYQRMARRGTEQAEQKLLKTTMEKVRRQTKAWYRDERKAMRQIVGN